MADIPFVPEHKLIAYADGFLPPAEMAEVESALTRSPALAKRVARIKQTRELAAASFDEAMALPLPAAILKSASGAANAFRRAPPFWYLAGGIAALCAGLLIGRMSVPSAQSPHSPRLAISSARGTIAGPELTTFLNTAESGQELLIGRNLQAEVLITFPAHEGYVCRQFKLGADPQTLNGVACHERAEWRVVILAEARPAGKIVAGAALAPDPVNAVIDQMIVGAPFDATQERVVLKSWTR